MTAMKSSPLLKDFVFRRHMVVNRKFESLLKKNGLDNFDALMKFDQGEVIKQKSNDRSTVRFTLSENGQSIFVYLKRYRFSLISGLLKNCLFFFRTYSAVHEWRTILAFKASGLPTMTPVAAGARRRFLLWNESFLLTEGIAQTKTLEQAAGEDYFYPPLTAVRLQQKRHLIADLAQLTRKMHCGGFNHQDFYLCHILVNVNNPDDPLLYIADLHRVRREKKIKQCRQIKDLAALDYSAPQRFISRSDRLRFMKQYDSMLAKDRCFLKRIIKKTAKIRSHDEKHHNNHSA